MVQLCTTFICVDTLGCIPWLYNIFITMSVSGVNQNEGKLWFKTQEEINDYDDRMIAAIELKSEDFDDTNFSPLFTRVRKEFFLEPNENYKRELKQFMTPYNRKPAEYLDKYHGGKKNNSFWREWSIERNLMAGALSYFLLRDLPIRNFYARCWIMVWLYAKYCVAIGGSKLLLPGKDMAVGVVRDQWLTKKEEHYDAWNNVFNPLLPTFENRIPERYAWKMRQPAYLDDAVTMTASYLFPAIVGSRRSKPVTWDGTFTQPLERLCDYGHKDARFINFIVQ